MVNIQEPEGCYLRFLSPLAHSGKYNTNIMKNTCPNDNFTCPHKKKKKKCIESHYVHNNFLYCPIWATVIFWYLKMLARVWRLLAPGKCLGKCLCSTLQPYKNDCLVDKTLSQCHWALSREVPGSIPRPSMAVVSLSKALYHHCIVPRRGLKAISTLVEYTRKTKMLN